MRLRQSTIRRFMDCPAQVRFAEMEQLPEAENFKAYFGTVIHFCLEKLNLGEVTTEQAIALFLDLWENPAKLGANPTVMPKMTTYGGLENKGIWILENFQSKYRWEDRELIASERQFLVPFGRHELSGTVDLIELRRNHKGKQILRVCDYKTNTRKPSFAELALNIQFCADEQTEILTRRGWMTYEQVIEGEDVLTLNHETDQAEWQPATSIHVFPNNQPLISMEGKAHSSLTTKAHRWPVERTVSTHRHGWRREKRFVSTTELTTADRVLCAAPVSNLPDEPKWADAFVELVAWYWTEGEFRSGGQGSISQSEQVNPDYTARIRACLTSLYGPRTTHDMRSVRLTAPLWREGREKGGMVRFHLNKVLAAEVRAVCVGKEKLVQAEFVQSLTKGQLELFIATSIDADGWTRHGCREITQAVKGRLDVLQMACSLAGVRTVLRQKTIGGAGKYAGRSYWSLALKDVDAYFWPTSRPDGFTIKEIPHNGHVWCPSTANQTWLARRDGAVYFTGNTVYSYATTCPEFWDGLPEDLFGELAEVERRSIWYHLWTGAELDAGTRTTADFQRLHRVCDQIERAYEADVFVPDISGETCIFCPFVEPCCGVSIPTPDELIEQEAAWA